MHKSTKASTVHIRIILLNKYLKNSTFKAIKVTSYFKTRNNKAAKG